MTTEEAFESWWFNEGSGMPPLPGEDAEAYVHRIARIAWLNGAFKAEESVDGPFLDARTITRTQRADDMSEYQPNKPIWKSYVNGPSGSCFFVSTIERTFDTAIGSLRGLETIVWLYDWDRGERGEMLHQADGLQDHQEICRCLIATGELPKDEQE